MPTNRSWRAAVRLFIFTTALIGLATAAAAQPFMYVGESAGCAGGVIPCTPSELMTLDTLTGRIIARVSLGPAFVRDVVVSPNGSRAYAAMSDSTSWIAVVDTALTIIARPTLGSWRPVDLAISPDGTRLYVTATESVGGAPYALVVLDTASYAVLGSVSLTGEPRAVELSPTGSRAYVTVRPSSTGQGLLVVVDTTTLSVTTSIAVGNAPDGLAVSPDGATAYVGNTDSRTVSIVETGGLAVTREVSLPLVNGSTPMPEDLTITADGANLYVKSSTVVLRYDVAQDTFTTVTPSSGSYVGRPERSSDGRYVYFPTYSTSTDHLLYYHGIDAARSGDTDLDRTFQFLSGGVRYRRATVELALPPMTGCLFEVTDRNRAIDAAGGTGVLTIPAPAGCTWTLDGSAATFVTFTSPTTGTGPGTVGYSIPAYTGTSARQDIVRVNGQDVRFSQLLSAVTIDTYTDGSTIMDNPTISGWAIDPDQSVTTGSGVDAVHVWAYPNPGSGENPIFLGAAQLGVAHIEPLRLGYPARFMRSGFTLATTLPIGRYQIVAFAHRTSTNDFSLVRAVVVTVKQAASVDAPQNNATVSFPFMVGGWAIDPNSTSGTGLTKVEILATPASGGTTLVLGTAAYGGSRPDVAAAFGSQFQNSGFNFTAQRSGEFSTGVWRIALRLTTDEGLVVTRDPITVAIAAVRGIRIDTPTDGDVGGTPFTLAGWAINGNAPSGTGVDAIHVWAWPTSGAPPRFLGVATLGVARPDIAAVFGSQFGAAGFSLVVTDLPAGDSTIVAYAHSVTTGQFDQAHAIAFHCYGAGFAAMNLDGPIASSAVRGTLAVGGWALDGRAAWGTGVDAIHVWAFPTDGGSPVFIGVPGVQTRPDVARMFGSRYMNAGFTGAFVAPPPGMYDLAVYAHSTVTGQFDQQRVVRITIQP